MLLRRAKFIDLPDTRRVRVCIPAMFVNLKIGSFSFAVESSFRHNRFVSEPKKEGIGRPILFVDFRGYYAGLVDMLVIIVIAHHPQDVRDRRVGHESGADPRVDKAGWDG